MVPAKSLGNTIPSVHIVTQNLLYIPMIYIVSKRVSGSEHWSSTLSFHLQVAAIVLPLVILYQWKYHFVDLRANIGGFIVGIALLGNLLCGYFDFNWPKLKRS